MMSKNGLQPKHAHIERAATTQRPTVVAGRQRLGKLARHERAIPHFFWFRVWAESTSRENYS